MPRPAFFLAPFLAAAVLAMAAGPVMAQNRGGGMDRAAGARERGDRAERAHNMDDRRHERGEDHRALSDAVRRVERRTGGQVLSAERVPFDGRNVNRVKVIDSSGRVRVYMDDPQQGARRRDRRDEGDRGDD